MRFTRFHLVVCCALLSVPLTSAAQRRSDEPEPSAIQRRWMQKFHERTGWHFVNGFWLRESGSCRWDELVRLSWRGSDLTVEVAPTTQAAGLLKGGRRAAVEIDPSQDFYEISLHEISPIGTPPELQGIMPAPNQDGGDVANAPRMYVLARALGEDVEDLAAQAAQPQAGQARPAPARAGPSIPNSPLRIYSLMASPGVLRVNGRGMLRGSQVSITFFGQMDRSVRLSIHDAAAVDGSGLALDQTLVAESFQQLMTENPLAVRRYLSPLLRPLCSADLFGPGATDVYLTFPQVAPSAEMISRVNELLPQLHDQQFAVRQAAMTELRELGAAGVCAASHLKFDELSPQQQLMIRQLLSENSRCGITADDAEAQQQLRNDALFLVDCLEFDDPDIRAAAAGRLRDLLKQPVKVDASDRAACNRLAEKLRSAAPREATTKPQRN